MVVALERNRSDGNALTFQADTEVRPHVLERKVAVRVTRDHQHTCTNAAGIVVIIRLLLWDHDGHIPLCVQGIAFVIGINGILIAACYRLTGHRRRIRPHAAEITGRIAVPVQELILPVIGLVVEDAHAVAPVPEHEVLVQVGIVSSVSFRGRIRNRLFHHRAEVARRARRLQVILNRAGCQGCQREQPQHNMFHSHHKQNH